MAIGELTSSDHFTLYDHAPAGEEIRPGDIVCRKIGEDKLYKYDNAKKDERVIVGVARKTIDASKTFFKADEEVPFLIRGEIIMAKENNLTPGATLFYKIADSKFTSTYNATTAPKMLGIVARKATSNAEELICYVDGAVSPA